MVEASISIWRDVRPIQLDSSSSPLLSTRISGSMRMNHRLSRTGDPIPNNPEYNGLWSCIQEDRTAFGIILYNRGEGKLTHIEQVN